jgi:hypothetical protein
VAFVKKWKDYFTHKAILLAMWLLLNGKSFFTHRAILLVMWLFYKMEGFFYP